MSPTEVSNITQTLPKQSNQKSQPPPQDREPVSLALNPPVTAEKQMSPVDTVSILYKTEQIKSEVKKESAKNEAANISKNKNKPDRTIGDVQFAYNFKGDLRVRFMDRGNRLIYQIPPELVARVADTISQPNSSVDTKA